MSNNLQGQKTDKRAQTGMNFLTNSLDARSSGLGNAVTSLTYSSSIAMFYNPASMGWFEPISSVAIGQVNWFADIDYNYASAVYKPANGQYGLFGVSFLFVDYGDIQQTIRADNEQGYLDIGTYKPYATMIGLGYSIALSEKFSIGANIKYAKEDLGTSPIKYDESGSNLILKKNRTETMVFDFGLIYKTGFKSLTLGMSARNFAKDLTYEEESFELPLSFQVGLSINAVDFTNLDKDQNSILLSLDMVHPRDYSEQAMIGLEYTFIKMFSLRAGYTVPTDLQGISFGAGFQKDFNPLGLKLDYSFTQFNILGNVHRVSFHFSIL
jgi:hypothetical protein